MQKITAIHFIADHNCKRPYMHVFSANRSLKDYNYIQWTLKSMTREHDSVKRGDLLMLTFSQFCLEHSCNSNCMATSKPGYQFQNVHYRWAYFTTDIYECNKKSRKPHSLFSKLKKGDSLRVPTSAIFIMYKSLSGTITHVTKQKDIYFKKKWHTGK